MSISNEDSTPKEWIKNCLTILQDSNPNFRLNKDVKGTCIEFIREDYSGIFVSVNFLRKRVLGKDTYYLCFGLSLTSKDTIFLNHPLLVGSRFDNNGTIWHLFTEHLGITPQNEGYPKGVWSFGEWRSNTMEHLKRGLIIPEEYLLPYYQKILKNGKERLLALFKRASEIVPKVSILEPFNMRKYIESQIDIIPYIKAIGIDPELILAHSAKANVLTLLNIAKGGKCWFGFGPKENTFDIDSVPIDAIILNSLGVFLLEKERLSDIVTIIEKI